MRDSSLQRCHFFRRTSHVTVRCRPSSGWKVLLARCTLPVAYSFVYLSNQYTPASHPHCYFIVPTFAQSASPVDYFYPLGLLQEMSKPLTISSSTCYSESRFRRFFLYIYFCIWCSCTSFNKLRYESNRQSTHLGCRFAFLGFTDEL